MKEQTHSRSKPQREGDHLCSRGATHLRSLTTLAIAVCCTAAANPVVADDYVPGTALKPTMLKKGKNIFEKRFDSQREVDRIMDLRKHTKGTVKDGVMVTIPPSVHGEAPKGARYGKEEFVRSHFKLGGQDYIFSFRVKFLKLDRKVKEQVCFIDLGHRWIRLELTPEGSQLVFQNYILGKRGQKKVMVKNKALQLKYGQWYEGTIEILRDETLFNINGVTFHIKNDLVAKKRETVLAQRFCLDLRGVGYHLDYAAAWKPIGFQIGWEQKRTELKKNAR